MNVGVSLLLLAVLCGAAMAQEVINIGFIYSGSGQYITAGVQPAVYLAVEMINNSTNILPGYQLNISYTRDSECDPAQSQEAFFPPQLSDQSGPDNIAIVGCGCSLATEPIAEVSQYWNMIHMSYASSSDILSNGDRFPNFWRTYPTESNLANSVLALMKQYNWKQLKIISQNEPIFTSSTETLYRTLNGFGVTVVRDGGSLISSNSESSLNDLFTPEVRVYMLNMYPRHARRVLCEAARAKKRMASEELRYEKYVWITLGWYGNEWWRVERLMNDTLNCTNQDVEQFLPNTLAVIQANTAINESSPTNVGLTAEEFQSEYNRLLIEEGLVYEHSAFHAYDAIWTLAFAMNSFIQDGGNLASYSRLNSSIYDSLNSYRANTDFIGVSGQVLLNENGTRVANNPKILKYRDSDVTNNCGKSGPMSIERERIGYVNVLNLSDPIYKYFMCEDDDTTWPDGVPVDGLPRNRTVTILQPLVIVYYTLTGIGLIFALVCLLFNIIFRNRKIVKLISPNLNYVIVFGCCCNYLAVFFFVFPSLDHDLVQFACHIRLWLQAIGYFSSFGVILFKMLRVYIIFKTNTVSKKKRSKIPKDWQLFLGVCAMLLIICLILAVVVVAGKYEAVDVEDKELPPGRDENGTLLSYHNLVCSGPRDIIWIAVVYGYILITHLVAVVLAFLTRKINIKALNDYKYISAITYISFILLLIMLVSALTLDEFLNADAAVFSGVFFIFSTVVLTLTFIPKMVILYKDPKGEKIFQRSMSQAGTILGNQLPEDDSSRYLELEQHCKQLEGRLAKSGEVVPTFRPRAESSFKLKSTSFSSMPPPSPSYRSANMVLSLSQPSTPTHTISSALKPGTSDYFTEGEERNSTASSTEPKELEDGKLSQ
ncbi:gamma-aminobutyric acid type B receptor subunit 1-like [Halichondria panicea]|uniref:gamma-aminobutyric acid type B receptor subunit 1-like n=1 Tax=Halichondria panicea TaxID=6063 RepID=UPI00312B45A0